MSKINDLIELRKQMKWEDEFDYDSQAAPRFWVIMDYRLVPGNEEHDMGFTQYFYSDGDFYSIDTIEELREEIQSHFEDNEEDIYENEILSELMVHGSFEDLWEYLERNLNDNGFYSSCYVKEEEFIVPNTLFLTKQDAKRHLEMNKHHYSSKAHTYAMTAWRSKSMKVLWDVLMDDETVIGKFE